MRIQVLILGFKGLNIRIWQKCYFLEIYFLLPLLVVKGLRSSKETTTDTTTKDFTT